MDENRKTKRANKESIRHFKGKLRLSQILRVHGFKTELERRFPCTLSDGYGPIKYRVDVYGTRGIRRIICEIDGYIGHKTQQAHNAQKLRAQRIRDKYGEDIEIYRFTFSRLTNWTDQEIAEEMRL